MCKNDGELDRAQEPAAESGAELGARPSDGREAAPRYGSARERGRSARKLLGAVTGLLEEREPEQVTITEIVSVAGVTRPTFYAVYRDLPAAFAGAAIARLSATFDEFSTGTDVPPERLEADMGAALLAIATRLEEHGTFFARVLRSPGGQQVYVQIIDFVAERLSGHSPVSRALAAGPLPVRTCARALAAGVMWSAIEWLDEEARRPAAQFADQLLTFLLHAVFAGLGGPAAPGGSTVPGGTSAAGGLAAPGSAYPAGRPTRPGRISQANGPAGPDTASPAIIPGGASPTTPTAGAR